MNATIAFLDVDYGGTGARAACLVVEVWTAETARLERVVELPTVEPYEPGSFFRRELPCLLAVLETLPSLPETLVIDGYVQLSADGKPGLGTHLHAALGGRAAVIGAAKSRFRGIETSPLHVAVCRGGSHDPLWVSSLGTDLAAAAEALRTMHGPYRIPTLLRRVDHLARGRAQPARDATS